MTRQGHHIETHVIFATEYLVMRTNKWQTGKAHSASINMTLLLEIVLRLEAEGS